MVVQIFTILEVTHSLFLAFINVVTNAYDHFIWVKYEYYLPLINYDHELPEKGLHHENGMKQL
jgi:hypothetical protein